MVSKVTGWFTQRPPWRRGTSSSAASLGFGLYTKDTGNGLLLRLSEEADSIPATTNHGRFSTHTTRASGLGGNLIDSVMPLLMQETCENSCQSRCRPASQISLSFVPTTPPPPPLLGNLSALRYPAVAMCPCYPFLYFPSSRALVTGWELGMHAMVGGRCKSIPPSSRCLARAGGDMSLVSPHARTSR